MLKHFKRSLHRKERIEEINRVLGDKLCFFVFYYSKALDKFSSNNSFQASKPNMAVRK